MTDPTLAAIDIDELCKNPEENGFNKKFHCDRCGSTLYCAPDFDPPGCGVCNPELWNGEQTK